MFREDDPSRAKDRVLVVAALGERAKHVSCGSGRREGGSDSEGAIDGEREREREEEKAERRREDDEWESCMLWVLHNLQERDSLNLLHIIHCCGHSECSGERTQQNNCGARWGQCAEENRAGVVCCAVHCTGALRYDEEHCTGVVCRAEEYFAVRECFLPSPP